MTIENETTALDVLSNFVGNQDCDFCPCWDDEANCLACNDDCDTPCKVYVKQWAENEAARINAEHKKARPTNTSGRQR